MFVQRTGTRSGRLSNGHHAPPESLIAVWAIEDIVRWPDAEWQEELVELRCAPVRLFDYPVDMREVRKRDADVRAIGEFRGGSAAFALKDRHHHLAVARACALPADMYDCADIDRLAARLRGHPTGDIGASWRRLSPGRWRARSNVETEWVGMRVVAEALASAGWGLQLLHRRRGIGYDIYARKLLRSGSAELRVEVKGSRRPWSAPVTLTSSERQAGAQDPCWLLATVHDAAGQPDLRWWSYDDVVAGRVPTR